MEFIKNIMMKWKIPNLELHEGLPSLDKVQSLNDGKFHVIVLDDLWNI